MLNKLKQQLEGAAAEFTTDAQELSQLLSTMAEDVQRAIHEPLEIFPVAHHSPAAALHMVRRLQQRPPKVIYIELCEDMRESVANLEYCKLPVALQAFASESNTIEPDALPVTVVAPLTEASAEYQAIAYCLQNPETQLVFVDRAVDYVFQWQEFKTPPTTDDDEPEDEDSLHHASIGIQSGEIQPTFDAFVDFLLHNSNTRHFAEWWEQYVERTIINADLDTYRHVMVLMGSLIRHLGRKQEDITVDELRERYMWTRMKQHLAEHQIQPEDAIYICGAVHAASDVPEFGTHAPALWDELPPVTHTQWLYGIIPSSFIAIERQFSHPVGTVSLAEVAWQKSMRASRLAPFTLGKKATATKQHPLPQTEAQNDQVLFDFMTQAPEFSSADHDQLLDWCTRIVALARKNGYLSSTADTIAIYETTMLLANIRSRMHPSAYDFTDATITCLEKDRTPKKRNIAQLCRMVLGGDRVGVVGYESLPPLAQNIYDRLEPLGIDLFSRTNQRALMDFTQNPHLLDCSELLWRLNYLLGDYVVHPIIGERKLGHKPLQESWEIRIGKYQREVIQLGYEGVTLEQVLEQRMRQRVYDDKATASTALYTTEATLLFLDSPRLTREFGEHATHLLTQESGVADAPEIFDRARRLIHHYRTTPEGLPQWIEDFVTAGYTHYASLMPYAMTDGNTAPKEVAGMLSFIFVLEGLALSLGCSREQIIISVQQAGNQAIQPEKQGLQWVAEWLLKLRTLESMREALYAMTENPMLMPSLPIYLNSLVLSLTFAPQLSAFVVEILSKVFTEVPDSILIPWLPGLILQLREHQDILSGLMQEASSIFPNTLQGMTTWTPQWLQDTPDMPVLTDAPLDEAGEQIRQLLLAYPQTLDRLKGLLT